MVQYPYTAIFLKAVNVVCRWYLASKKINIFNYRSKIISPLTIRKTYRYYLQIYSIVKITMRSLLDTDCFFFFSKLGRRLFFIILIIIYYSTENRYTLE